MLDGVSLDQLRTFIAAVEEGSFSAAGRKLMRAQSVVSQTISNLEGQLGVALFDRAGRLPRLTGAGSVLFADAKAVVEEVNSLKARAKGISKGMEPELSVAIDVMFPLSAVTQTVQGFAEAFPATRLRLHVEILGGVVDQVLSGRCGLGIIGSLPDVPDGIRTERIVGMSMLMVVAPDHPLGRLEAPATREVLSRHTQLVLTDRTAISEGQSFGVLNRNIWRLSDMGAKHAFLLAGLGWGGMPLPMVEADLAAGRLKRLAIEDQPPGMVLPMSAAYPADAPPGPAGRWFVDALIDCARNHEAEVRSSLPTAS